MLKDPLVAAYMTFYGHISFTGAWFMRKETCQC